MKKLLIFCLVGGLCTGYISPSGQFVRNLLTQYLVTNPSQALATAQEKLTIQYHKTLADVVWYLLGKAFTGLQPQLQMAQEKGLLVEKIGLMTKLFGFGVLSFSVYNIFQEFGHYRRECKNLENKIKEVEKTIEDLKEGLIPAKKERIIDKRQKELGKLKKEFANKRSYLNQLATPILIALIATGLVGQLGHGISITGSWISFFSGKFLEWKR